MKRAQKEYVQDGSRLRRKRRKKRRRLIFRLLVVLLGTALAVLIFVLLFYVQKIEVVGNQYCTEAEVIRWIKQDKLASNSLYVWGKYNYTDVEQLPLVEESEISLINPWTIRVRVYEKTIIGCLELDGEFIYFDRDGLVILMSEEESIEGIPKIEGIQVKQSEVKAHKQLPVKDQEIFSSALEVTREVEKCELTPDRIVFEDQEATLYFGNVRVLLGEGNMDGKVAQIGPILEKLQESQPDAAGTLHLETYGENSKSISFVPDTQDQGTEDAEQSSESGGSQ